MKESANTLPAGWPAQPWPHGGKKALVAVAATGIVASAHLPSLAQAVEIWRVAGTYQFAWAVLPTFLFLVWFRRAHLFSVPTRGSLWGISASIVAAMLWSAAYLMQIMEGMQLALILGVWAIFLSLNGPTAFRRWFPFLALLVFLVPTGSFLLTPLKQIAVMLAGGFASLAGLPFVSDGFTLYVGPHRYVVINDCAGLPYLLTAMFVGTALGLMIYRTLWKIVALALFGAALAIIGNAVRIITILLVDHAEGGRMGFEGHVEIERPIMALVFIALLGTFAYLKGEKDAPMPRPQHQDGLLACIAATVLFAITPTLWKTFLPQPVSPPALGALPTSIADWTRSATPTDWAPNAKSAHTTFEHYRQGASSMSVFVAQAESATAEINNSNVDVIGQGAWMHAGQSEIVQCTASECFTFQHRRLLWQGQSRVRQLYFTYLVDGQSMNSPLQVRLNRVLAQLTGHPGTVRVVAIAIDNETGLAPSEVADVLSALTRT